MVVINKTVVVSTVAVSDVKTSSEVVVAPIVVEERSAVRGTMVVVSWIVAIELSVTTEVIASDVSVVKTDEGRHGPALTPLIAKRASAPVKIEDENILKVNE